MELKPLKVSELNQYIKRLIISDPILYNINIEGEISNFKHHHNGHMYFTIKDDKSKLKCIMFSDDCEGLLFTPQNGMYIFASGYISVYDREGTYQLYAKKLRKKGMGELFEALQELKVKLKSEGLFDEDKKKPLPFMPKNIGIITSSTGAAVRDIVTTIKRRMKSTNIFIYQVMVQGEKAEIDICKGIKYFNEFKNVDVVIVARGGGSIEELWAFNKEQIAREIYKSKIPIISAVGHETDITISDFVSDKRASTPSVAGEIVVPSYSELEYKIKSLINNLLNNYKIFLDLQRKQNEDLKREIDINNPKYTLKEYKNELEFLLENLNLNMHNKIKINKDYIDKLVVDLDTLSPLSTLKRGFSIVTDIDGNIKNSIKDVNIDETLEIRLEDGYLEAKILNINGEESKNG